MRVIKIRFSSNYPRMELKTVTRIDGGKIYLDASNSPTIYSARLIAADSPLLLSRDRCCEKCPPDRRVCNDCHEAYGRQP